MLLTSLPFDYVALVGYERIVSGARASARPALASDVSSRRDRS